MVIAIGPLTARDSSARISQTATSNVHLSHKKTGLLKAGFAFLNVLLMNRCHPYGGLRRHLFAHFLAQLFHCILFKLTDTLGTDPVHIR